MHPVSNTATASWLRKIIESGSLYRDPIDRISLGTKDGLELGDGTLQSIVPIRLDPPAMASELILHPAKVAGMIGLKFEGSETVQLTSRNIKK